MNEPSTSDIRWNRQDYKAVIILATVSGVLLLGGLGIRTLWGAEDRWANVTREMMQSKNYFLPTINGRVYFDKPLLSYWAIIPFAKIAGDVTETAARLPGAIAALLTTILTFIIGRRLFDRKTGFIAGLLFSTSVMTIYWLRCASADALNLLFIWFAFWTFIAGAKEGRLSYTIAFYCICAAGSFFKGLVVPAVVLAVVGFYSVIELLIEMRKRGLSGGAFKEALSLRLRWLISVSGAVGVLCGIAVFVLLFLMPMLATGSWESAQLMWRENVQRFFEPFDHKEPFYVYFEHSMIFAAPWSLLFIVALVSARKWEKNESKWLILLIAAGIFIFFTASGSRRSYYIMPLIPAMAIIIARALRDWFAHKEGAKWLGVAFGVTVAAFLVIGILLLVAFFTPESLIRSVKNRELILDIIKKTPFHLPVSIAIIGGAVASILLLIKNRTRVAFALIVMVAMIGEIWLFTAVVSAGERGRTLARFCITAREILKDVPGEQIALYRTYRSHTGSIIYYLRRSGLDELSKEADLKAFLEKHPQCYIITEDINVGAIQSLHADRLLTQKKDTEERANVLLKISR